MSNYIVTRFVQALAIGRCTILATVYNAAPFMGPAYWIPAFWVPALLVTHYLTFLVLLRGRWPAQLDPRSNSGMQHRGRNN
jgi:hypothetical protein